MLIRQDIEQLDVSDLVQMWASGLIDMEEFDEAYSMIISHKNEILCPCTDQPRAAAQAELDFLRSLLPADKKDESIHTD